MRFSHQAKGRSSRHSQPNSHPGHHPTLMILPVCGKTCGAEPEIGQAERKKRRTKHAVKMMNTGVDRHIIIVLLIVVDGASNAIRSRTIGPVSTVMSNIVQVARKLAGRPTTTAIVEDRRPHKKLTQTGRTGCRESTKRDSGGRRKNDQTSGRQTESDPNRNGRLNYCSCSPRSSTSKSIFIGREPV